MSGTPRLVLAVALFLSGGAGAAVAQPLSEIGYKPGSLAVAALAAGNYRAAEAQLNRMDGVAANDPARLINLGQVYARTGRYQEAERAYRAAMDAPSFDIVLTNGVETTTRDAARAALSRMQSSRDFASTY